jgi:hypothetical protein
LGLIQVESSLESSLEVAKQKNVCLHTESQLTPRFSLAQLKSNNKIDFAHSPKETK